jgi:hypothetical protein
LTSKAERDRKVGKLVTTPMRPINQASTFDAAKIDDTREHDSCRFSAFFVKESRADRREIKP